MMDRPKNILETGAYIEPYTFPNDEEALLFHSLIKWMAYAASLEQTIKFLNDESNSNH